MLKRHQTYDSLISINTNHHQWITMKCPSLRERWPIFETHYRWMPIRRDKEWAEKACLKQLERQVDDNRHIRKCRHQASQNLLKRKQWEFLKVRRIRVFRRSLFWRVTLASTTKPFGITGLKPPRTKWESHNSSTPNFCIPLTEFQVQDLGRFDQCLGCHPKQAASLATRSKLMCHRLRRMLENSAPNSGPTSPKRVQAPKENKPRVQMMARSRRLLVSMIATWGQR